MQCYRCGKSGMRLVRYQGSVEIWACRACGAETPLLDCHCCERRGVHLAMTLPGGENVWDCASCGNRKRQCVRCAKGWIVALGGESGTCSHCGEPALGPPQAPSGQRAPKP